MLITDYLYARNLHVFSKNIFDKLVKSHKIPFSVIPAKAGIQSFQALAEHLDSGFRRSDDFLRVYHFLNVKKDWLSGIGGTSGDIH
jgi:hypothetical protein